MTAALMQMAKLVDSRQQPQRIPTPSAMYSCPQSVRFHDVANQVGYNWTGKSPQSLGRISSDDWWILGLPESLRRIVEERESKWYVSARTESKSCTAIALADTSEREGALIATLDSSGLRIRQFHRDEVIHVSGLHCQEGLLALTDDYLHIAMALNSNLDTYAVIGKAGTPEDAGGTLTSPAGVVPSDESFIVGCNTMPRAFRVDFMAGTCTTLRLPEGIRRISGLAHASGVGVLIADTATGQVLRLDPASHRLAQESWPPGPRRMPNGPLRAPRCVQSHGEGMLLADCLNNRLVMVDGSGRGWAAEGEFVWPRAVLSRRGEMYVAEGLHGRVTRLLQSELRWEPLSYERSEAPAHSTGPARHTVMENLGDPHHLASIPGGGLLITDSSANDLVAVSDDGVVAWRWSDIANADAQLHDPHQAWMHPDGTTWIVDSLNHRVLRNRLTDGNRLYVDLLIDMSERQDYPRCILPTPEREFLLTSRSGLLTVFDSRGRRHRELQLVTTDGLAISLLDPPRSLAWWHGSLVIPDHDRGVLWTAPWADGDAQQQAALRE